jgi:transcription elongation factor Elf1
VHSVSCPNCGAEQAVSATTVLHPGDRAVEELFAGHLNRVSCLSCGTPFVLDVPILFRDDEDRYLVYFMSLADGRDWRTAEREMRQLTEKLFAEIGDMVEPECRLVTTRGDLIEKIALHARNLDDRLVEYVKYQLMQNPDWQGKLDPVRHRMLYDFSSGDGDKLAFIVFDRETGDAVAGAHLPMDDFRDIEETFEANGQIQEELDRLFPGYYVSVDRLL